jgi:basic amino acid/polyamine antiporter, APA family
MPHTARMAGPRLERRLGVGDAVVLGLGSMIGAGVFSAFGPAARAAGAGLLIGLAVAGVVAYCNATSSARLAALYPRSGGTYVYGRERLGRFWGYLAGWSFVVGKTASCAAMALTFATYAWPQHPRWAAVLAVAGLTALSLYGVQRSAWATRVIVTAVLAVLALVVVAGVLDGRPSGLRPFPGSGVHGVLQSAGLLFFAFAGYARIATLGEEVRDPARTIPRAVSLALLITVAVYAAVALAVLLAIGAPGAAASAAPLRAAVEAGGLAGLGPVVRLGGALAALGSLLALLLGVSRTTLAMARDRYLPGVLDAVDPRRAVPRNAELAVAAVVVVLVLTTDLRGAIGFSSFGVLVYYGIANASAATLTAAERRPPRWLPAMGLIGCAVLAVNLPLTAIVTGAGVLAIGAALFRVRDGRPGSADGQRR